MYFNLNSTNFHEVYQNLIKSSQIIDIEPSTKLLIIGNQRLKSLISKGEIDTTQIQDVYKYYLDFGLLILFTPNSIEIYNDIYGAYPLFCENTDNQTSIKNYFKYSEQSQLNKLAVVEQIHFNHFLGSNTLCLNTERLPGGHKIKITSTKVVIENIYSWDDFINDLNNVELSKSSFEYLTESINQSINPEHKVTLTLTGGYDSRILFGSLLKSKINFDTITWSKEESSQVSIARDVSEKYGIAHSTLYLDDNFDQKIDDYLEEIIQCDSELSFITDVPPFIHLCKNLEKNQNLISGFMGSEIIRGPSYSSEVTLTKFAASIQLCESKQEIKQKVLDFQNEYKVISDEFLLENLDAIVENYTIYSRIGLDSELKNLNIFKYLFREKYPKIFGHIIKLHQSNGINTINPYLDFKFIVSSLRYNLALNKMNPYENNWYQNFVLYRFYANMLKENYPSLLKTKLDRGYHLIDLITVTGWIKIVPYQFYRKWKKSNVKPKIVVDSFKWFYNNISIVEIKDTELDQIIENEFVQKFRNKNQNLKAREKIMIQHILGIRKKINYKVEEHRT
jgi:hypothetical protein